MSGYYTLDVPGLASERESDIKQPFPHQRDAFIELSKTLPTPIKDYRGTLLVLPTGAGKTFTSVNWICRNILSQNIKVLWLAQSSYLIDQAAKSFIEEIHHALERNIINLRVVSSSAEHSNAGSISLTDDVLICTTQTAIGAYSSEQLDGRGKIIKTPFRRFVDSCREKSLFVVIDEAHHTPAYGCRTLLLSMREDIQRLYILGLTATPMHMDKRISGWLRNIYNKWICYEADKSILQATKVLAIPKYIEKSTGLEYEVDDSLFDRVVNKHKDLPEEIVENLANNQGRNNLIISDYVENQKEYGKTLIFADRWFQCEYLVEKLKQEGINAAALYSVITGQDTDYLGGTGRHDDRMNREILDGFRNDRFDVLVNVRMLTEGVDIPDVKTVVVTRQTTSNILLTQMIGRALRGEKTGGGKDKAYANVVFFYDSWKRLLPWAEVPQGADIERPIKQGRKPMSLVSIQLIKLAVADIEYKGFENAVYLTFIPVGFFGCEFTIAIEEGGSEELISFEESIVVYEFNKNKYDEMIDYLLKQDLTAFAAENVPDTQLEEKAVTWMRQFFNAEKDGFDGMLAGNIAKIVRHIAQNGTVPTFLDFHDRDFYDMDKLAEEMQNVTFKEANIYLHNKFNDMGLRWNYLYKRFENFQDAFFKALKKKSDYENGTAPIESVLPENTGDIVLSKEERIKVFTRDNYSCLSCGKAQRKGVSLQADHIIPVSMGGRNAISNLQTLCKHCNALKGVNEIDFRANITPLGKPKGKLELYSPASSDDDMNALARIVNEFYHCRALCNLNYHQRRSGQFYSTWEIVLFSGNNPEWLAVYEVELLRYINHNLKKEHVKHIVIRN